MSVAASVSVVIYPQITLPSCAHPWHAADRIVGSQEIRQCQIGRGNSTVKVKVNVPNRTNALGSTPAASRIMSLTLGWEDLMVGYEDWMNCLL